MSLQLAGVNQASQVLSGIDLAIKDGETLAVLGPSGAGKSVLLRVLAGLMPPTQGQVEFLGRPLYPMSTVKHRELARDLGIAFQKGGLIDALTVAENLELPLAEVEGVKGSALTERVHASLEGVGLLGNERLFPHELSGGMQKRLGVARAFLMARRLVILDEPTAGLDPVTSVAILDLVAGLRAKKKLTVVVVGSQPEEVLPLCDSIAFIDGGRITQHGSVKEVLHQARGTAKRYFFREIEPEPIP